MVFDKSSKRLFLKFKKITNNTLLKDELREKTTTLNKWLNRNFNSR